LLDEGAQGAAVLAIHLDAGTDRAGTRKRGILPAKLTGQTRDRETPIVAISRKAAYPCS
jgi:hypothetical protein